jgi:hypothetical protein
VKHIITMIGVALVVGLLMALVLLWSLSSMAGALAASERVSPGWQASGTSETSASGAHKMSLAESGAQGAPEPLYERVSQQQASRALSGLPLQFIVNAGQTDESVRFTVRGASHAIFFGEGEITFSAFAPLSRGTDGARPGPPEDLQFEADRSSVVWLRFPGANPQPHIEGGEQLAGAANFFLGDDPAGWQVNLPTYASIIYRALYPGIDLIYRGNQGHLKSEFLVSPGANPDLIRMEYSGLEGMHVRDDGTLILETPLGELMEEAPLIYQEINGNRHEVTGRYELLARAPDFRDVRDPSGPAGDRYRVGFRVGPYDPDWPLIIDPVLIYCSYLGGGRIDAAEGVAVSDTGDVYVTGWTTSADFPTHNAITATHANTATADVFVTQIISSVGGYTYGYSTYLGGTGTDQAFGIALDGDDNVYVTGETSSDDFPTQRAIQATRPGTDTADAFVAEIMKVGGVYTLAQSTYLGGSERDTAYGIAVDSMNKAYVTGITFSSDFPTHNAIQATYVTTDAFVVQIVNVGGVYTYGYASYLGGHGVDVGRGIAVPAGGSTGSVYVTGYTDSSDFPTRREIPTAPGDGDVFVTKIIEAGGVYTYDYSTYVGGRGYEYGSGIAVNSAGDAYITGWTSDYEFPIHHPIQDHLNGGSDAFVAKIVQAGEGYAYGYSTYLGGGGDDYANGIAVDSADDVFVVGTTYSTNFPTRESLQPHRGSSDAFVTKIVVANGVPDYGYSTYLGGTSYDYGQDIAVASDTHPYVVGYTVSDDFPTQRAIDSSLGGVADAFVAQLGGGFTYLPIILR